MELTATSFVDRIIGAIRLDPATYREVKRDPNATGQAMAVVALVAILSGIGATREGTGRLLGGVVAAIIFWAIYTFFVFVVGKWIGRSAGGAVSFSEVLRPLGFSYAPSMLAVLGFIPGVGQLIVLIGSIWSLVASIFALRETFSVSTGRAIAIAIIAIIAMVAVLTLVASVLGIGLYGIMQSAPQAS